MIFFPFLLVFCIEKNSICVYSKYVYSVRELVLTLGFSLRFTLNNWNIEVPTSTSKCLGRVLCSCVTRQELSIDREIELIVRNSSKMNGEVPA